MYNIGDEVIVEGTICKIVDVGEDESGTVWYSCTPIDFDFPREFTEDKIKPINS